MKIKANEIEIVDISKIIPNPKNPNSHSKEQIKRLGKLISNTGFRSPLVVSKNSGFLVVGHGRLEAAKSLKMESVPVIYQEFDNEAEEYAYMTADNAIGSWSELDLNQIKLEIDGFKDFDIEMLGIESFNDIDSAEENDGEKTEGGLVGQFLAPPFSVIDARQGYWKKRKDYWLSIGIKSEVGREDNLIGHNEKLSAKFGMEDKKTSIFDPALAELAYTWFSPFGATIIDPFAGGSVRGIVAARIGRSYLGHELRAEQVMANREQAEELCSDNLPIWEIGDSRNIDKTFKGVEADLLFTCPPYADLEVYSDDPADISNMSYNDFIVAYRDIIKKSCSLLKDDSFACVVVGEARGKNGIYYNFVGDTVRAFIDAGLSYYNEAIFISPTGNLQMRAGKMFRASRKLGKGHQNVLVFVKGDWKKAAKKCGDVEVMEVEVEE